MLAGVFAIQSVPTLVGATCPKNDIEVRETQLKNALLPMLVTPLPMVAVLNPSSPPNVALGMVVTPSEMIRPAIAA
jgi:hypothetical protein